MKNLQDLYMYVCVSVQFIRSVVSDSLRPHATPWIAAHQASLSICVCIYIYKYIMSIVIFILLDFINGKEK